MRMNLYLSFWWKKENGFPKQELPPNRNNKAPENKKSIPLGHRTFPKEFDSSESKQDASAFWKLSSKVYQLGPFPVITEFIQNPNMNSNGVFRNLYTQWKQFRF